MPKSRNPSATATKKTKPALSPKTSAAKATKKVAKSGVLGKVLSGADQKSIEAREIINSQISHMGNRPIALVATNIVGKGIDLNPKPSTLTKKPATLAETKSSLSLEVQKMAGSTPSEILLKKHAAEAKIVVNSEIVKKAVVKQIAAAKGVAKKRAASPLRTKAAFAAKEADKAPVASTQPKAAPATSAR